MLSDVEMHPELQALIPPLTEQEYKQLEINILADGCRDAILLWQVTIETGYCKGCYAERDLVLEQGRWECVECQYGVEPELYYILDGHNRYTICNEHNVSFKTEIVEDIDDLDAAKAWMVRHQLGRRNLTPEQMSYLRGKQYQGEKKAVGRPENNVVKFTTLRTEEKLGAEHQVSAKTIRNDAAYATAVDTVTRAVPDAKQTILTRDTKVGRQEVKQLATIAEANPQTATNVLEAVKKAATPKAAKAIIRGAAKQAALLPKPQPKHQPSPPPTPLPSMTLVAQEPEPKRGLETVHTPDGKEMFILHKPESKSVFNETNEMVDWAKWTWNPVTGCWHGCDYCYAREIANSPRMADAYPKQFEPTFHPSRLDAPKNTPFPKVLTRPADKHVFTCSMADLFGKWVPDEWIMQVFERVTCHQEWNFLFLTKFPQRLRDVYDKLGGFPLNAWVGCTVDSQARVATAERAFENIKASVCWLSVEPMKERLTFSHLDYFDWLVMGGQTASYFNKTPAFQPEWEWVDHLWQQARTANVKIYWKENLTVRPKEVPWS